MVTGRTRRREGALTRKNGKKNDLRSKQEDASAPVRAATKSPPSDEAADAAKMERRAVVWAAFDKLRAKANQGDRRARLALVRFCNKNPQLWAILGDTARLAETNVIDTIAKEEWLTGRAIAVQADQLRKGLSRPGQSALEEIAVRRFVACWTQVNFIDSLCSRGDGTVEQGKFWLARQSQSTWASIAVVPPRPTASKPTRWPRWWISWV
jgi:hypothetical protein